MSKVAAAVLNEEIPIEKNVPIPDKKSHGNKYPWRKMEVGDSFFVPGKSTGAFSGACRQAGQQLNRRFSQRTVEGGVRVWRVE